MSTSREGSALTHHARGADLSADTQGGSRQPAYKAEGRRAMVRLPRPSQAAATRAGAARLFVAMNRGAYSDPNTNGISLW